jgi:hypothetical protein
LLGWVGRIGLFGQAKQISLYDLPDSGVLQAGSEPGLQGIPVDSD